MKARLGFLLAASIAITTVLATASCAGPKETPTVPPAGPSAPTIPAPAPARPLALPPSERFVYASGASLTIVPVHELPVVSVLLFSEGGARAEPADKTGLASFTAGLLDEGPAGMTREQFLAKLDRLGASFESRSSLDDVSLSLDFMARDLDAGLELLLAAALKPAFDEAAVERAKARTLAELAAGREDEAGIARDAFFARLFPDHRYGRPLAGTPESVQGFSREDALVFQREAFAPAKLRVIVVGDVKPVDAGVAVARAAAKHDVELGVAMAAPAPAYAAGGRDGDPWLIRRIVLVHKPGVVQPQVLFGCRGPDATHPQFTALRAANIPFGGGFTSWLVDRLRVDLGLTYSAGSAVQPLAEGGVFYVRTFSKNATIGQLLTEAFALVDKLARGELDAAALERARLALRTRVIQQMETTSGSAGLVKQELLFGLGADSVARTARELDALTTEAMNAAVAEQLPDSQQVLCVVVGDAAAIGEQLRALGPVEVVDYRTLEPIEMPAAPPGGGP